MSEDFAERHERESAEFVRSSKDAMVEYERLLKCDLSSQDRRAVREALDLVRRQLACFAPEENPQSVPDLAGFPAWVC